MRKTPRHRQPGRAVRAADRISRLAGGLTAALVAGAAASAAAIAAEAPRFSWPVDCVPGKTCYIQKYVDRDAGPGWADFACGALSNDKHTGTDIALFDYKTMQRGVAVRAAAPGRVTRTRDGVADVSVRDAGTEATQNRECGNGVVIDHGDGWRSQYCHLRKGSIAVRNGEFVQTGDPVGLIGLSGATEYPHVHFEIRRDRTPVDPFDGAPMREACNVSAPHPLWAEPIAYSGAGIINIGFTAERPTSTGIDNGDYAETSFTRDIPMLYFFVRIYGLREGDRASIRVVGPKGSAVANPVAATGTPTEQPWWVRVLNFFRRIFGLLKDDRQLIRSADADADVLAEPKLEPATKNQVRSYWWIGVRRPGTAFPAGTYRAEFRLHRKSADGSAPVIDTTLSATLR